MSKDNIIILDHYRETYSGNGALEALTEIVYEYSDAVEDGHVRDIAEIILGQLWVFGFKIVPLDEEDINSDDAIA